MKNNIALVIGSTGLIGSELVQQLCEDKKYSQVISFVRRQSGFSHAKLQETVVDFDNIDSWKHLIQGDVLYSCMGTTRASAGSKAKQYQVDYMYQYQVAAEAANNGVRTYVLISAAGASRKSPFFYSRIKGELDHAVQKLSFEAIHILRPGQLYGNRKEKRTFETFGLKIMFLINKLGLFKKYKPIHASVVSSAMINIAQKPQSSINTLDKLFELAQ